MTNTAKTTRKSHRDALTLIGVLLAVAILITPIRYRIDHAEHADAVPAYTVSAVK